MSEALRIAVVRLATDPAAYEELIRDPNRALACVPTLERQLLEAGDAAGLAAVLAVPAAQPSELTWIPGWPQAAGWPPPPTGWSPHAAWIAPAPAAWPASYSQLPGWPYP